MDTCSICRQPKPIAKRLEGGTVAGSVLKRRSLVLVCVECSEANDKEYHQSQVRFVTEQIDLIDNLSAENPNADFTATREEYVRTLRGLEFAPRGHGSSPSLRKERENDI